MTVKRNSGFTLVELMIAVAIIGILASIVYPAYQQYIRQTYRTDAYASLGRMAELQEQFYNINKTYAVQADIAQVGGAATQEGYYTLTIPVATASGYTLVATAVPGTPVATDTEGAVSCSVLTFTSAQQMLPKECWRR